VRAFHVGKRNARAEKQKAQRLLGFVSLLGKEKFWSG
jgi:hypothetical protein